MACGLLKCDPDVCYRSEAGREVADEKHVAKLLESKGRITLAVMGIGAGREIDWLRRHKNVDKIIGIDRDPNMLNYAKEKWGDVVNLDVVNNDFETMNIGGAPAGVPVVYLCLINTLGNLGDEIRLKTLRRLSTVMRGDDRAVFCLFKLPKSEAEKRAMVAEYVQDAWCVWGGAKKATGKSPSYCYDDETNDIVVSASGGCVFSSHRWSENEVRELHAKAGLEITNLIDGERMYVIESKKANP